MGHFGMPSNMPASSNRIDNTYVLQHRLKIKPLSAAFNVPAGRQSIFIIEPANFNHRVS
jgi:hypothetical protein